MLKVRVDTEKETFMSRGTHRYTDFPQMDVTEDYNFINNEEIYVND